MFKTKNWIDDWENSIYIVLILYTHTKKNLLMDFYIKNNYEEPNLV